MMHCKHERRLRTHAQLDCFRAKARCTVPHLLLRRLQQSLSELLHALRMRVAKLDELFV